MIGPDGQLDHRIPRRRNALDCNAAHRLAVTETLEAAQRLANPQTGFNPVNPRIPKILVQTSAPAEINS